MACYLQLMQGGHLNLVSTSGSLLLTVCNDDDVRPAGGRVDHSASSHLSRHALEMEMHEARKKQEEATLQLQQKEKEIEAIENKRLKALSDVSLQNELMALIIEARRLEQEREELNQLIMRFRLEEEDILIILYSLPFMVL